MEHQTHENGVVIYNPTAGRGTGAQLFAEAQRLLGKNFEWIPTRRPGHAEELAKEAATRYKLIVAMGGDGTVGDVCRGIVGADATLGILPVGTGNDLARNLGLKLELAESVATILGGAVRKIDVGTINGKTFINNCGTGFDAQVMKTMNTKVRHLKGYPAFLWAILQTLPTYQPFTLTMEYENAEGVQRFTEKALLVSALNGKMYGGGMIAAPFAEMDDGHLDVLVISAVSKFALLPLIGQVRAGNHLTHPAVKMLKVRKFSMQTIPPQPINIDGDVSGLTPAIVEVKPNCLKVMVR